MSIEAKLQHLLHKYENSGFLPLTQNDVSLIIDSCIPTRDSTIRTQALLLLSKFVSSLREKYPKTSDQDVATSRIVQTFAAPLEARLGDPEESSSISALSFLSLLFQLDAASAGEFLARDGCLDAIMDIPDLYTSSGRDIAMANLFSQASGHKQCITLLSSPQVTRWLEQSTKQTENIQLRAAAAVALAKLLQASDQTDPTGIESSTVESRSKEDKRAEELIITLKTVFTSENDLSPAIIDVIEGLAYLTVRPSIKELLSRDKTFLKKLMSLTSLSPIFSFSSSYADRSVSPRPAGLDANLGLNYGVAAIIMHLSGYRPQLTDEEKQIERLKRMTKEPLSGKKIGEDLNPESQNDILDSDDHVRERCRRLIGCNVVQALNAIVKRLHGGNRETRSIGTMRAVAAAFLNLIEDKQNRGHILQGGASKTLLSIIQITLSGISFSEATGYKDINVLDSQDLKAIQALAKLSITSPPPAVFGPGKDSYVDGIRPFAILLAHSSASLMQKFEAIMALTNIASIGSESAARITTFHFLSTKLRQADVGDIVKLTKERLLDNNVMLRRASVELICNLVGGDEAAFDYFGGTTEFNAKSKLHILFALSDVDDLPTRLAASGALAILTSSPFACKSIAKLEMERHRVLPILVELISPDVAREYREEDGDEENEGRQIDGDPGLVHRGVVCVRNIFANLDNKDERKVMSVEAERRGLVRALLHTIKSSTGGHGGEEVLKSAAEVLKWIMQTGVKIPI